MNVPPPGPDPNTRAAKKPPLPPQLVAGASRPVRRVRRPRSAFARWWRANCLYNRAHDDGWRCLGLMFAARRGDYAESDLPRIDRIIGRNNDAQIRLSRLCDGTAPFRVAPPYTARLRDFLKGLFR